MAITSLSHDMTLLSPITRYFTLLILISCGGAYALAGPDLTNGEWKVEAVQTGNSNVRLQARLVFTSQITVTDGYQLEGYFDWLCLEDSLCHGRELFRGFLSGSGRLTLAGENIVAHPEYGGPLNIWPASYAAYIDQSGDIIERGRWPSRGIPKGEWRAIRMPEEGQELWEWVKDSPSEIGFTPAQTKDVKL